MSITPDIIKRFMKKMNMRVFMIPDAYEKDKIRITCKVKREDKLEIFFIDWFGMDDDGKLHWRDTDIEMGVQDGIFKVFGDKNAVDNFFFDMSMDFAQKYMDDKIKS